MADNFFKSS